MTESVETQEQKQARKEETEYKIVNRNAVAIAETLTHHDKVLGELHDEFESFKREIAMLKNELAQQRQIMVKALQVSYGHGSTA